MKLQLPDVTLVCLDTICHELAAMAVRDCLDKARFGAVHIHTDKSVIFKKILGSESAFDYNEEITFGLLRFEGLTEVMRHLWYEVPQHIKTSHALVMQWDSGIVDPSMWSEEFLQYDYIGAPWGWHGDPYEVGNGGFSLRSAKLMRFMAKYPDQFPLINPEDDTLCRKYRLRLEDNGFRFAPIDVASRFSFERTGYNGGKHFGYHGVFNWPLVLPEQVLQERMKLMTDDSYLSQNKHLGELINAIRQKNNGKDVMEGGKVILDYSVWQGLLHMIDCTRRNNPEQKLKPVCATSYRADGTENFRAVHNAMTNQISIEKAA